MKKKKTADRSVSHTSHITQHTARATDTKKKDPQKMTGSWNHRTATATD
jgi:hypothetical protein